MLVQRSAASVMPLMRKDMRISVAPVADLSASQPAVKDVAEMYSIRKNS